MLSSEEDSVRLKDVLATVHPCTGSAVIFNHDMIHEGLPVLEGKKYIVRTEIMFKRTNKLLSPLNNPYLKDEKYLEYENIDPKKCTETYIKAQNIQCEHKGSISKENDLFVPMDMFICVFTFLTPRKTLSLMTVCKDWYYALQSGVLWKEYYQRSWTDVSRIENKIDPGIQDWMGMYKQRLKAHNFFPLVIEVSELFQCGKEQDIFYYSSNVASDPIELLSYVSIDPRKSKLWYRKSDDDRFCYGEQAKQRGGSLVIERGKIINWELFPELISEGLRAFGKDSNIQPIAIIEHPNQFTNFELNRIIEFLFTRFGTPSVGIIPSPICSLCNIGETTGIVVFVRPAIYAVIPVWEGNVLSNHQIMLNKEPDAQTLATLIRQAQKSVTNENMRFELSKRIVLSGDPKKHGTLFSKLKTILKESKVVIPQDKFDVVRGGILISQTRQFKEGYISRLKYECDPNNILSFRTVMRYQSIPACKLNWKMIKLLGPTSKPKTIYDNNFFDED